MVDGIDVGTGVILENIDGEMTTTEQDFSKADLVIFGAPSSAEYKKIVQKADEDGYSTNDFPVWAIYGNSMISANVLGSEIESISGKTRVLWASRKPYILSGDN